jgi:hypothetical protein
VDSWLGVLLAVVPLICVVVLIAVHRAGEGILVAWISTGFVALVFAGVVYPLSYVVGTDVLVIRFGMVRSKLEYDSIKHVEPVRSYISAPAMSTDRLYLERKDHLGIYVSPKDKAGFL